MNRIFICIFVSEYNMVAKVSQVVNVYVLGSQRLFGYLSALCWVGLIFMETLVRTWYNIREVK